MFFKIIGWIAIGLGIFALAPSVVPGAMSGIGLMVSILALLLASISVKSGSWWYLSTVTLSYGMGVLFFNDGSRLFYANPNATMAYKLAAYIILIIVVIIITINKNYLKTKANKSSPSDS